MHRLLALLVSPKFKFYSTTETSRCRDKGSAWLPSHLGANNNINNTMFSTHNQCLTPNNNNPRQTFSEEVPPNNKTFQTFHSPMEALQFRREVELEEVE